MHLVPLSGLYAASQEAGPPRKLSITNEILLNFFTQTEFSHSKPLLKETVVKRIEKPGPALGGS